MLASSVAFVLTIRAASAHHEQDDLGVMIAQAGTATKQTEQVLSSRSAIREAQSLLSQLGYEPGPVDGLWGPKTASAYRSFLIDRNLPVASGLTASNLSQMRRASSGQPATQTTAQPTLSIYAAAAIGRMDQVDAALHSGVNVDSVDGRGWTALMYAADNNNTDVASLLIGAGANANLMAPDGSTALSLAEQRGHGETIALLSSSTAAARTNAERSTFRSAPAESRMTKPSATSDAATQFLLGLLSILDEENAKKSKPSGKAEIQQFIDLLGRRPSAEFADENGWTDLHWAAAMNLPALAKQLIDAGVPVNARLKTDRRRFSPQLVSDLERANDGYRWGDLRRAGPTALHIAAFVNASDAAKTLIMGDAKVFAGDLFGDTPLHYAMWGRSLGTARTLLAHDAGFDEKNNDGMTPLHIAAFLNFSKGASLLLDQGANVQARSWRRTTPLHLAASEGAIESARLLLDYGANADARDGDGLTPIDAALRSGNIAMLRLLQSY